MSFMCTLSLIHNSQICSDLFLSGWRNTEQTSGKIKRHKSKLIDLLICFHIHAGLNRD